MAHDDVTPMLLPSVLGQPKQRLETCSRRSVALTAVAAALMLVLCALVAESKLLSLSSLRLFYRPQCSPDTVNASSVAYSSVDPFYNRLRHMAPLPAPTFLGCHKQFCNATYHQLTQYDYCLPISGRYDDEHCSNADRMDLLVHQSPRDICHASVLHMLMVDVYEEIRAVGAHPLLAFGTLLGAVRN